MSLNIANVENLSTLMQEEELKNASFDPRIGFTIRNLLVKDSNWYKCSIEQDGEEHAVNYVLSVHRKCGLDSRC